MLLLNFCLGTVFVSLTRFLPSRRKCKIDKSIPRFNKKIPSQVFRCRSFLVLIYMRLSVPSLSFKAILFMDASKHIRSDCTCEITLQNVFIYANKRSFADSALSRFSPPHKLFISFKRRTRGSHVHANHVVCALFYEIQNMVLLYSGTTK